MANSVRIAVGQWPRRVGSAAAVADNPRPADQMAAAMQLLEHDRQTDVAAGRAARRARRRSVRLRPTSG